MDPIAANEVSRENVVTDARLSRALESLGRFAREDKPLPTQPTSTLPPIQAPKFASAYYGEPEWHQRWAASKGPEYFQQNNASKTPTETTPVKGYKRQVKGIRRNYIISSNF